jgi:hypothetical protein
LASPWRKMLERRKRARVERRPHPETTRVVGGERKRA